MEAMTPPKWIALIAFLSMFSFMAEVKSSATCQEEVVQQLEEALAAVENYTYSFPDLKSDCADLHNESGELSGVSGVYVIKPDDGVPFDVYCDQEAAGGGWTVIQKRLDGSVDFYRDWANYKKGFGDLKGEFWLGLDKIHRLAKEERNIIRVELEDIKGETAYAEYDMFVVANETAKYELSLGSYSGTAGDSFAYHDGAPFSTKDQDNDLDSDRHCAETFKGAWWYNKCQESNLNGIYRHGYHGVRGIGINWFSWKGDEDSARRSEMKIRPADY